MAVLTDRVNLLQGRLLNGRPIFLLDNSCRVWTSSIFADGTPDDVLVPENVKSVYGVDCEVTTFEGHPHLMFCDTDEDPIAEVPDWDDSNHEGGDGPVANDFETVSGPRGQGQPSSKRSFDWQRFVEFVQFRVQRKFRSELSSDRTHLDGDRDVPMIWVVAFGGVVRNAAILQALVALDRFDLIQYAGRQDRESQTEFGIAIVASQHRFGDLFRLLIVEPLYGHLVQSGTFIPGELKHARLELSLHQAIPAGYSSCQVDGIIPAHKSFPMTDKA